MRSIKVNSKKNLIDGALSSFLTIKRYSLCFEWDWNYKATFASKMSFRGSKFEIYSFLSKLDYFNYNLMISI